MSCEHAPDEVFWQELNEWQLKELYEVPRRGRRGDVVLKLDLTCIEKTGKRIPFARVFNRAYGIQLVVLHVCFGGLSFPMAYRIYRGKGKETPVDLALELLERFPASSWSTKNGGISGCWLWQLRLHPRLSGLGLYPPTRGRAL